MNIHFDKIILVTKKIKYMDMKIRKKIKTKLYFEWKDMSYLMYIHTILTQTCIRNIPYATKKKKKNRKTKV